MKRKHWLNPAEVYLLPRPVAPPPASGAFILYPLHGVGAGQWLLQQWLYARALEQARAVAAPSILERDLLAVWN